jgi:hypothetical protein
MGLYIRDEGVHQLAHKLAEIERRTLTETVRSALEERWQRLESERDAKMRKLREIQARVAALPELAPGSTDEDLYDENGDPIL